MKRIRITHTTEYFYKQQVRFGPHRALMRPREGHDVHVAGGRFEIEPKASVRWLRDLDGNSAAIITHQEASPLSGSWAGPADAFDRMEVSVQVVALGQGGNS